MEKSMIYSRLQRVLVQTYLPTAYRSCLRKTDFLSPVSTMSGNQFSVLTKSYTNLLELFSFILQIKWACVVWGLCVRWDTISLIPLGETLCAYVYKIRVCVCGYLAAAESWTADRESNRRLVTLSSFPFITSSELTAAVKARLRLSSLPSSLLHCSNTLPPPPSIRNSASILIR